MQRSAAGAASQDERILTGASVTVDPAGTNAKSGMMFSFDVVSRKNH
jgi:hypothetical protein